MPEALPPFPAAHADHLRAPPDLRDRGIRLRPAAEADLPFLRELYAGTRADELAALPWPASVRQAFLDSQFDLQHRHYVTHFGSADFMVVEDDSGSAGRLYLLRTPPDFHLVDIALSTFAQRGGTGRALITHIQQQAAAAGCGVDLHVDRRNADARRLYERLGFLATDTGGSHLPMHWRAPTVS
jgi:ribosomal protein S18 acetylase RimI-like enzyme